MAKMTKTQVRFRAKRMKRDIAFLLINSPEWCKVSSGDYDSITRISDKYLKQSK